MSESFRYARRCPWPLAACRNIRRIMPTWPTNSFRQSQLFAELAHELTMCTRRHSFGRGLVGARLNPGHLSRSPHVPNLFLFTNRGLPMSQRIERIVCSRADCPAAFPGMSSTKRATWSLLRSGHSGGSCRPGRPNSNTVPNPVPEDVGGRRSWVKRASSMGWKTSGDGFHVASAYLFDSSEVTVHPNKLAPQALGWARNTSNIACLHIAVTLA